MFGSPPSPLRRRQASLVVGMTCLALGACTGSADCMTYRTCLAGCTTLAGCLACSDGTSGMAGYALTLDHEACIAQQCIAESWLR